jgi:hypothetical protein
MTTSVRRYGLCGICGREKATVRKATLTGPEWAAMFCRVCDRRQCAACGHSEQDITARRCSSCQLAF